jgi:tetratricopeptide (TPR) repeat protein
VGDTVNLAARMENWAAPGSIYLTEATRRAAADHFEFRDLGLLEVKGKGEAVHAHELLREIPGRTRLTAAAERGLTPYVGREQELAQLSRYFDQARSGRGQVVFVSGEAGIGKSRLLLEYRRSLGDSARWVEGHCISFGGDMAYVPIVDLLKRTFDVEETDDESQVIARVDAVVARWEEGARRTAPYLKFLLSVDPGDRAVAEMDALQRRAGIIDGLRAFILQESRDGPIVVVIEDLHWIDSQSQDAIAALIDVVASAPVLLVLSYRPGYAHTLGDRSYYNHLSLRQLPVEESAAMAASALGAAALPDNVRHIITSKAEGNPFFVEEVAKSLVESGAVRLRDGAYQLTRPIEQVLVPDTIQEVILSRIDRLAQEGKTAIQLASVIGREFTARLLERISDVETRLEGVLAELKALELIYEKAYFPELAYMFKHALTHEVALSTLLSERRKALHRVVAGAIEELYTDRIAEHYEVLAYHYHESGDLPKALDYLIRAAEKSAAAYANAEAVLFYGRAIDVCERLGDDALPTAWELARKQAFISFTVGEMSAAVESAERMVAAARRMGDRHREGWALVYRCEYELWAHAFGVSEKTARSALAIGEEGFDDVRWLARLWLSSIFSVIGRLDAARELEPFLQTFPEDIDDEHQRSWWVTMVSMPLHWRGQFDEAVASFEANVARFDPATDIPGWIFAHVNASYPLMAKGEYQRALDTLREMVPASEHIGELLVRGRALNCVGWIHGELQDPETALQYNQRSIEVAIEMDSLDPEVENNARLNCADNYISLGRLDEAEEQLRKVERAVRHPSEADLWARWLYSQHYFHTCGELWLKRGDPGRALAYADECLELAESTDRQKNVAKGRRLRGQALIASGDLKAAEPELATAVEIARRVGNPRQLWESLVALGDLFTTLGRFGEARGLYVEAVSVFDRVAEGLTDASLRKTFVASAYVRGVHGRLAAASAP